MPVYTQKNYNTLQPIEGTTGQKKKDEKTLIYFNTNYLTEMKLVPLIINYCLLQFDALKFS